MIQGRTAALNGCADECLNAAGTGAPATRASTCTFIIPLRGKAVTGVAYGAVGGRDYSGLVSAIKGSRMGTVPVARGDAHAETRVRIGRSRYEVGNLTAHVSHAAVCVCV